MVSIITQHTAAPLIRLVNSSFVSWINLPLLSLKPEIETNEAVVTRSYFGNSNLAGKNDGAVIMAPLCKVNLFSFSCLFTFKRNCNSILYVSRCSIGRSRTRRLRAFNLSSLLGITETKLRNRRNKHWVLTARFVKHVEQLHREDRIGQIPQELLQNAGQFVNGCLLE